MIDQPVHHGLSAEEFNRILLNSLVPRIENLEAETKCLDGVVDNLIDRVSRFEQRMDALEQVQTKLWYQNGSVVNRIGELSETLNALQPCPELPELTEFEMTPDDRIDTILSTVEAINQRLDWFGVGTGEAK